MGHKICIGLVTFLISWPFTICGEEFQVKPLTEDEETVLSSIAESRVLETVSFLASDEMNGRSTPSKELEAAASYVAGRFEKAGLEGLGPDGSFLQAAELSQVLSPKGKASLTVGSETEVPLVVLTGMTETLKIYGVVQDASGLNNSTTGDDGSAIFVVDEFPLLSQATDDPLAALVTYVRRTNSLVRRGAKVVLVRVADDSILFDTAAALQLKPVTIPWQFNPQCAIVLVSKAQSLDGVITLEIPANILQSNPVHNVIGVLRGSDQQLANQAVIISAHLDHIGPASRGEDKVNNGADDNASGVTGVLMLAEAFAALNVRPKRSIVFMTFWGEEKGLLGSKYFVEHPLWDLENVVCNINLEMIGRPEAMSEGKAWGTGWSHSSLGPQMAAGAIRAGVPIFHHEKLGEMLYTRSDNASFVAKGIIAHSFSAGSLHSDYHQPTDEVEKLNIPHMTKVIHGLMAGILPIAFGEQTPTAIP